jgi:hypothetical protein
MDIPREALNFMDLRSLLYFPDSLNLK